MTTTLFGYWRSSAAYRLRIALNLKGVAYDQVAVNLKEGEQSGAGWLAVQPQGLVPVLEHDGERLLQSPAILEWIDGTWPEPGFLPRDPVERCRVRGWASIIGCDIHPLQNLRVLKTVAGDLGQGPDGMKAKTPSAPDALIRCRNGVKSGVCGNGSGMASTISPPAFSKPSVKAWLASLPGA